MTVPTSILCLGDSITVEKIGVMTYWDRIALESIAETLPFVYPTQCMQNGHSGFTTADLLANWSNPGNTGNYVAGHTPDIATVLLGTNDALMTAGVETVSPAQYEANLRQIVTQLQAIDTGGAYNGGHPFVVLISPPFIMTDAMFSQARYVADYIPAMKRVARELGCAFVDANTMTKQLCGGSDATWISTYTDSTDGVHPNTLGHAAFYPALRKIITMTTPQPYRELTATNVTIG